MKKKKYSSYKQDEETASVVDESTDVEVEEIFYDHEESKDAFYGADGVDNSVLAPCDAPKESGGFIPGKILIRLNYPGKKGACCGKNMPHTRYRMAIFDDKGLVEITPEFDSHMTLLNKHGLWCGSYASATGEQKRAILLSGVDFKDATPT